MTRRDEKGHEHPHISSCHSSQLAKMAWRAQTRAFADEEIATRQALHV